MVIEPRDRHIDGLTNDATPAASDHQRIVERPFSLSCARAPSLLRSLPSVLPPSPRVLVLSLAPSRALSLSLSVSQRPGPAIICYVRDSKLTAILASCHSYVLPFVSAVARSERLCPRPSPPLPPPVLVAPGRIKCGIPVSETAQHAARITGVNWTRGIHPRTVCPGRTHRLHSRARARLARVSSDKIDRSLVIGN